MAAETIDSKDDGVAQRIAATTARIAVAKSWRDDHESPADHEFRVSQARGQLVEDVEFFIREVERWRTAGSLALRALERPRASRAGDATT